MVQLSILCVLSSLLFVFVARRLHPVGLLLLLSRVRAEVGESQVPFRRLCRCSLPVVLVVCKS